MRPQAPCVSPCSWCRTYRRATLRPRTEQDADGQANPLLPGRGQADLAPRHPLAAFEQDDLSSRDDLEGLRWTSEGAGDFEVETITRPARGTSVTLHLREGEEEFLSGWKLKSIVSKYSAHISLPIL